MRTNQLLATAKIIAAVFLVLSFIQGVQSQTTLVAGDIAFTGYNSDNPDNFSFVLLKNVQAGTTLTFTDKGWKAAGGFRAGESTLTITFAADRITGEQFQVPANAGIFLDFAGLNAGTSVGTNIQLSSAGDQLFAYQGTEPLDNSPAEQARFIAAIQMNGPWDADATNDNNSALPPGLTNGLSALAISPQVDNARYNCAITGPNIATLRTAIHNPANWLVNDNIRFSLPAPCDMTCGLGTDNRAPVVFCPFELEEFLDQACDFTLADYRASVFGFDNCDPNFTISQSPAPGSVVSGNTLVTMLAQDVFGNSSSCSFQLFATDTIAPQITHCPGNQTGTTGQGCLFSIPNYTGWVSFTDNCDPAPAAMQSPVPGTLVSQNTTIVITIQDASGNIAQCTFLLILKDETEPQVFCSIDRFANFGPNCSFTLPDYSSQILVVDECDPTPQILQFPPAGTVVHQNTQISFKISDAAGNQTSCAFNLILLDITPPLLQCQAQYTVPLNANCQATMPDLRSAITLSDNCDPNPGLLQIPAPGTPLTGNSFVALFATDASNNFNFCFAPVFVRDQTPPVVTCQSATVALNSGGAYTLQASDVIASMSDNCGPVSVVSIQPSLLGCQQAGLTVPVTVTVQDAAGNTANCTTNVTVSDVVNIPSAWTSTMIGNNGGGATFRNCDNSFIVYSAGFNFGTADAIQFVHRPLCGNGEIIAHIGNVDNLGSAGIMMRETLAPGSKKAAIKTKLSSFVLREVRTTTNGQSVSQQFPTPGIPRWLRLVRTGSTFQGFTSVDGVTWDFRFVSTISMASCIYVGIFSESINGSTTTTSVFDNVTVIGASTPLRTTGSVRVASLQTEETGLEVSPNPAVGETQVRIKGDLETDSFKLMLLNSFGQIVWTKAWDKKQDHSVSIALNELPAGVYVLQAKATNGVMHTAKVVVQR